MRRKRTGEQGFTLIELLAVVTIIGILSLLAAPKVFQAITSTKQNKGRGDLPVIAAALDQFYMDRGYYPQNLQALVDQNYLKHTSFKNPYGKYYLYAVNDNTGATTAQAYALADPGKNPASTLDRNGATPEGRAPNLAAWAWKNAQAGTQLMLTDNGNPVNPAPDSLSGFRLDNLVTE